jgi:CDP-glycerol glycerophosphotransferase
VRILWHSFHGRYSDNPRALYERLRNRAELDHVWLAHPAHAATFPPRTIRVDVDGPDAREALESADLVVSNTHIDVPWRKPAGTTYAQTWHGTPLKRVHRDVLWAPEGRLDRLDRDVAAWDLLLSPNRASTPRLRSAFRYDGEILESGYPRNDLLSSPEADVVRAKVRAELGIGDSTAVLYAPTWRDDEVFGAPAPRVPLARHVEELRAQLGEEHVLLVRAHSMVTDAGRIPRLPAVHDVSNVADVRDLYAATDVLVTDYSSAMFDFAITGRPMIFFAYDLDRFATTVRGFYFDFRPEAPGPVVSTTHEVVAGLQNLPELKEHHASRYSEFQIRYAALEDGHAGDRVLARLGL